MLTIIQIPVLTDNYIYLLHDQVSGETAVIDPALAQPVLDVLDKKGWRLTYVFNTHHHWDHVGGNLELKQKTDCKIIAAQLDEIVKKAYRLAVIQASRETKISKAVFPECCPWNLAQFIEDEFYPD